MSKVTFVLLAFAIVFSGCKKIRKLTYFNISQSTEFTIPSANIGVVNIPTVPVSNDAQYQFKSNGTETKYVEEIKLSSLSMNIVSPASQNFNFLNSIKIYISAPGITEKLLAYQDNVPMDVQTFPLTTTGEVLDPYLKADSYNLRVETVTDEILTQDVKVKTDMVFRVRAKVLK
jgi:hypothetical protein